MFSLLETWVALSDMRRPTLHKHWRISPYEWGHVFTVSHAEIKIKKSLPYSSLLCVFGWNLSFNNSKTTPTHCICSLLPRSTLTVLGNCHCQKKKQQQQQPRGTFNLDSRQPMSVNFTSVITFMQKGTAGKHKSDVTCKTHIQSAHLSRQGGCRGRMGSF